ncbi:MAG: xanthine dehydrogenase family protein molybdopterin-binding subunit [Eudoraea sp.]|nr:xanthine dehydrogenase family protein molybdopterin-binding subunit [Eudoraea sp.]
MKTTPAPINRRQFLKSTGGVALFIGVSGIIPTILSCENLGKSNGLLPAHKLTAWVQLMEDGKMIVYNPAAEMGQGSMTSLAAIFAEEMDADWSKVQVEFSPQESATYGSAGWSGNTKIMLSAGSRVTKGYFPIMKRAGAQARYIMLHTASKKWQVPIDQLTADNGYVSSVNDNKRISFGDLVPDLAIPEDLPDFAEGPFKAPSEYQLIGQVLDRKEIPEKVDGSAIFTMDIKLPGEVHAILERGNLHGAQPVLENENEIKAMDGVLLVKTLNYAIAVVASTLEQALKAKKGLKIRWSNSPAAGFNSQKAYATYEKILLDPGNKGREITKIGETSSALRQARKVYTADFKNDYVYHAQMEPLNSIVKVAEDGNSAEVWVGSQQGFDSKLGVPAALGLEPEKVTIYLQYLGGGFGRRSMTDFVTECALLAKELPGKPIKLMWTREDDVRYGAYRPLTLQRLKAGVDRNGSISSLEHYIVGDGGNLVASGIKNDHYYIPNQYALWKEVTEGIRLKHWRAVGHGPNKFAIECLIDDIARDQQKDPVVMRRDLMQKSPRAIETLNKAAAMADWSSERKPERGKGVAFLERSGTLSTGICEISVNRKTGKITIHNFWSAHDAGLIIQPDNVKAQIEGGILMGISSVLTEQITILDGKIQQSNYNDYQILRMEDAPENVETALIDSVESPQGVGESGTPLVACAIANAFLDLTGKKLRHLPFTQERVLEALNT